MKTFTIDFFEFMFLVEACIPPAPIARAMFFEKVIDHYYYHLTNNERKQLFDYICRHTRYDKLNNEDCRLFYARYNPENQYRVKYIYPAKDLPNFQITDYVNCFRWNDSYHTHKNRFIAEEYIQEVSQLKP